MRALRAILFSSSLLIIFAPSSQAQVAPARITVFADSLVGTVSPLLFGSGQEMGQNLSDPLLPALIQNTRTPLIRFGGIMSEYYDWEANNYNGLWYVDWVDTQIIPLPSRFGVDSIARLCASVGAEPVMGVNTQINDPAKAGRWVEYCNGDTSTPMGRIRAQRGHPAPYNLRFWSLGNETDIAGGTWPGMMTFYRHFGKPFSQWHWRDSIFVTKPQFATLVRAYADTMRAHSPIPLEIVGLSLAGDLSWIVPVLGPNASRINYVDVHTYPAGFDSLADTTRYKRWLAACDYPWPLETYLGMAQDSLNRYRGGYPVSLALLEYNAGLILVGDPLWWNYLDGLFIADALGHIARRGLSLACSYDLYNQPDNPGQIPYWAAIRGDTTSRRMASWVFELYRTQFGNTLLKTTSSAVGQGNGLEAYGSWVGSNLAILVVNKNLDTAYATTVTWPGFEANFGRQGLDIQHDTTLAAPWNGTKGIIYRGTLPGNPDSMVYQFPKASVTLLRINHGDAVETGPANAPESRDFSLTILSSNPSRSGVHLAFSVPAQAQGRLVVCNALGQVVARLWEGNGGPERKVLDWKPGTITAGVYFLKLEGGEKTVVRKAVLVK